MDYVGLSHALNFMSRKLRRQIADDDLLLSWAWQGVGHFNIPGLKYMTDFEFLDVTNHKVTLPTGIKKIQAVYIYNGEATSEELDRYNTDCSCDDIEDLTPSCNPLYHRIFVSSDLIQNYFYPVYYAGPVSKNIMCKTRKCPDYSFSVNPRLTTMTLSEKTGVIALVYKRYVTDEDSGELLLTREPLAFWDYLGAHLSYKVCEELGMWNLMGEYKQQRKAYMNEARGALNLRSFNYKVHKEITFTPAHVMNLNQQLLHTHNSTRIR